MPGRTRPIANRLDVTCTMARGKSTTTTIEEYTAESCFSCRVKKRKCDKQLPACSRCKGADQQCLYGSNAHGIYGAIVPATSEQMMQIVSNPPSPKPAPKSLPYTAWKKSCRRCKNHKKFCDKEYPCCARCKRLGATCTYERVDRLRLLSSQHFFSHGLSQTKTVHFTPSYPVEAKPYMPELIRYFQDRMGLSALQVDVDSLAYHLRSLWIHNAMADPCLFHATLYTSSAHLDRLRDTAATSVASCTTLYHLTHTISVLNSRIASGGEMDDTTIASVLLLIITGSVQKDSKAAEVHRLGLLRMVAARGGMAKLGFNGFLAQMIKAHMVLPAVMFDQLDAFPGEEMDSPAAFDSLPGLALDRLRTNTKGNPSVTSYMMALFEHVRELLLAIDRGQDKMGDAWYDFYSVRDILDQCG